MRTRLPTCLSVGFGAFFASVAMGLLPLLAQCRQIANLSQLKLLSRWRKPQPEGYPRTEPILMECEITQFARVGCSGWYYRSDPNLFAPAYVLAMPARRRPRNDKNKCDENQGGSGCVAKTRVNRRADRTRQWSVQHAFTGERQRADDASDRIDHGRDPSIGGARQRQTLLDRGHACLLQMLVRSAGISKPAVIGDIDDPARPLVRRLQFARKNYLITDERQRAWRARRGDKAMSVAGKKPAALLSQRL